MFDISKEVENKDTQDKQQFWQDHVVAWEQSGIRQSEYCHRQGLKIKLFGYWKRKLCRKPSTGLTFVPVAIKPSQGTVIKPTSALRLIIRGGSCIEIGDEFNQDTLRRVLDTVGWTP
ncbi:MAG: hypothetical protein AABZ46_00870 [Nitrospirota bacterium]